MEVKIIEATQPGVPQNWGKFAVMRPDVEWKRSTAVPGCELDDVSSGMLAVMGWEPEHIADRSLLAQIGWSTRQVIVLDLQTCEAAAFTPPGSASYDLEKHRIWVCPLFQPFLEWLYGQDLSDLSALPDAVEVETEFQMCGYRRPGPPDLVGVAEIAEMRGFSRQRANQLSQDRDFPEPAIVFKMGPAWRRDEVEQFFEQRYELAG